jgi:hypothetical protein
MFLLVAMPCPGLVAVLVAVPVGVEVAVLKIVTHRQEVYPNLLLDLRHDRFQVPQDIHLAHSSALFRHMATKSDRQTSIRLRREHFSLSLMRGNPLDGPFLSPVGKIGYLVHQPPRK